MPSNSSLPQSIVSRSPSSAKIVSAFSPPLMMSRPLPPVSLSRFGPPSSVSFPPRPLMVSSPKPPWSVSVKLVGIERVAPDQGVVAGFALREHAFGGVGGQGVGAVAELRCG